MEHERVVVRKGTRTGLPVIIAVHSTALGQAIGGCRVWRYPSWQGGLADALRLAEGMTYKAALAGLAHGGGKSVVAVPPSYQWSAERWVAAMHDVGDAVDELGGEYATGPDVGTGPADMVTIGQRTAHVFCKPAEHGGSGNSSAHTATGVLAALRATCARLYGSESLAGRRFSVVGLGHVGGDIAERLGAAGAELVVSDIDPARKEVAARLGAEWAEPGDALTAPSDVVVPAALGGVLTADLVPRLRCRAVVGPANNQLAEEPVAGLLHERGILWAPDYVVSAGGAINAISRELHGATADEATTRVERIARTLTDIYARAESTGETPHQAALSLARATIVERRTPTA